MNMELSRIRGKAVTDFLDPGGTQPGVDLVLRLVRSTRVIRPIIGKLCQRHTFGHPGRLLLRFGKLRLNFLYAHGGVHADLFGIDLVERRMILDLFVAQWLGNGRVVYLTVTVAAVANQVDDHIGVECVAVLDGQSGNTNRGLGILSIYMKDGNGQPSADIGGEARRVALLGVRGKANQIVDDDLDGAAHGKAGHGPETQCFCPDAWAGKGRISMDEHRQHLVLTVFTQPHLLGPRTAHSDRIHRFQVTRVRYQVQADFSPAPGMELPGGAYVIL